ncbi:LysR family transcriptional regulator [Actinomycetospora straminea]|uniref:LysR family transcriptional regulator n=1 Tax=Actinomycetospora straminea TaxID=663607 RepID=A0ABP9ERU6_9PSEU|nr:LysR family transcriptional regulator [Actinomycetospora straminea]MDD7933910.1 LysR family transcriptional regulator [Actinomycetospora straminea]
MDLHQLRYLVAVAEEGGFTRAAAREHVAQPGISAQIARLERELGQVLFDRSARGVRLTPAGEAVLPHARAALAAVTGVRDTADELAGLVRGRVAVGMVRGGGVVDLPGLLGAFHRDHPGVAIRLVEDATDALLDGLRRHDLDLAWVGRHGDPPADLAVDVVLDVPLVAAFPPAEAPAQVTMAELAAHTVVALPVGAGVRAALDRAAADAGVALHPALEAGSPPVLADLAAQGLGVAVVPAPALAGRDDVRAVPIAPEVRAAIDLARRRDAPLSPAARALLDRARAAIA